MGRTNKLLTSSQECGYCPGGVFGFRRRMLFGCLGGRPPLPRDGAGAIVRHHLTSRPPELRDLGPAVPGAFDGVIQRSVRKDPRERSQSGRESRVPTSGAALHHRGTSRGFSSGRRTDADPGGVDGQCVALGDLEPRRVASEGSGFMGSEMLRGLVEAGVPLGSPEPGRGHKTGGPLLDAGRVALPQGLKYKY